MLRGAESRRELQVHFQPVVASRIRRRSASRHWSAGSPGDLLHLPAEFIGLAEETGEICPWVAG